VEAGGLADIGRLPMTEKHELEPTATAENPSARTSASTAPRSSASTRRAATERQLHPLTARDLDDWVTGSARSYAASGITAGQRIVSTYNAAHSSLEPRSRRST
jgi:phenylacetate-CoA ligase